MMLLSHKGNDAEQEIELGRFSINVYDLLNKTQRISDWVSVVDGRNQVIAQVCLQLTFVSIQTSADAQQAGPAQIKTAFEDQSLTPKSYLKNNLDLYPAEQELRHAKNQLDNTLLRQQQMNGQSLPGTSGIGQYERSITHPQQLLQQ